MTLNEFLDPFVFTDYGNNLPNPLQWFNNSFKYGVIHNLCEVDYFLNTNGKLAPIFYKGHLWLNDAREKLMPDDLHYMMRSGEKEMISYWEKFKPFLWSTNYGNDFPHILNSTLGTTYVFAQLLEPFYEEHIDNWLRLYDILTEPYRPFSNYYLDEEMVRNEKTGTDNAANATKTTSANRSTGTSTDNENGTSNEDSIGEVTNKVQGYNSTAFVDSTRDNSSGNEKRDYANSSVTESSDESSGSGTSDSTHARTYEEQKAYLLRYTGALDVDFQEWINKEIELRRRQLINEVIFADLDEYLVKGVW